MAVRVAVSEDGQVRGEEDLMRQCALKLLEGIDSAGELLEGGTTDEFKLDCSTEFIQKVLDNLCIFLWIGISGSVSRVVKCVNLRAWIESF